MDEEKLEGNYGSRKERRSRDKPRRPRVHSPKDHPLKNNGNAYNLNWSAHSMSSQPRMFPNNEPSYATFPSYHVSYPVDSYAPLSVYPPMYSTSITPPQVYPVPPLRKNRRSEGKPGGQLRLSEQGYASLPPVNCDGFSDKSSDSESNSKRHFSDPGVGPASSDESQRSCRSPMSPMYVNLIEEIKDLKDNRQTMASELTALREEFNELKMKTCSHCLVSEYHPGSFTDVIGELRKAAQLTENAILAKLDGNIQASTAQLRELLEKTTDRLSALECKLDQLAVEGLPKARENVQCAVEKAHNEVDSKPNVIEKLIETNVPDAFRMLHTLEQQKRQLEEDLKEAQAGRNEAEANTQKLERLVAILRTKINGLSAETSLGDENQGRGGATTIECNPFIIMDSLGKAHPKVSTEHNLQIENSSKCTSESKNIKSTGSPPIPVKTKTSSLLSSASNPSVPAKPNFSHLPKPVLVQAAKPSNGLNRHLQLDGELSCPVPKSNAQVTKFVVGKAVSAPSQTAKKFSDSSTDSSVDDPITAVSHLPASITITGPVTDL